MVHRSADSRLLASLISRETEYTKQLQSLLDLSHASFNSLSAYAASSPPPASQVILAVASSLSSADNALRGYAAAVEEWARYLKELKDLEDEVGNVMRDREILVTRLLKASKSTTKSSSNRDSFMFSSSPPASSSTLSLKSNEDPSTTYASTSFFSNITAGPISASKKMQSAQTELQACEAHLAKKELELDAKRSSTIRDGLRVRFRALAQCGWQWTEVGKEVEVVLGFGEQVSPPQTSNNPLPTLLAPVPVHAKPHAAEFNDRPSSDLSSIAPSQSASQIGIIVGSPPPIIPPTAHIYSDLEAAISPFSPSSPPLQISVPPAHSIDDFTLPTVDSDATITRKKHVLPHRITEEDLGLHGGMLSDTGTSVDQGQDRSDASDTDEDDERIPSDTRVVENHRFSTKNDKSSDANAQSGSTPSFLKVNGVDAGKGRGQTSNPNISGSGSGSGFFGSIRGLFIRKTNDRGRGDSSLGTEDNSSIDESQHPGARGRGRNNKARVGLLGGKNRKKGPVGLFSDNDEENGSVMSSPPAPLRMPNTTDSSSQGARANASSSFPAPVPRGRTMSEAFTPTATTTENGKRKLKKSGPGVGPRGKTASNDLADGELQQRRRSASVDYGDLSVRNRELSRPRSRAEEWVDGQQHEAMAVDDKNRSEGEGDKDKPVVSRTDDEGGGGMSSLTKKSSVKRRKSANRRSLPASSSSKSTSTSTLVLSNKTLPSSASVSGANQNAGIGSISSPSQTQPSPEHSASVSRNSSIRSTASAPSGPRTNNAPRTSVTRAHTLTVTSGNNTSSNTTTTKSDRRASSPPMSVSTGVGHGGLAGAGSTSLMSIVEDVAKANRDAWGKAGTEGSATELTTSTSMKKSIGGTIKPSGLLELVKAPRSIDLEDLKEQMDRDLQKGRAQNPNPNHSHHHIKRARSSSASAAASHHGHVDTGPSTSASAPLLAEVPVVINDNSQVQNKLPSFTPGHKPGQVVLPLRSALKNSSRTPSPMQPPQTAQVVVNGVTGVTGQSGQSSSPVGSLLGSNVSTAGSSGSAKSVRSGSGSLPQHPPARSASPLINAITTPSLQMDIKGKGKAKLDVVTAPGVISVIPVSGTIPSPPPENLSNSSPSPPPSSMQNVYHQNQPLSERNDTSSESGSDSSDAASISSYETGHEVFDDAVQDSGDETETGQGLPPPSSHKDDDQHAGGSDVSASSTSTQTPTQIRTQPQNTTANNSISGITEANTAVNAITTAHKTGSPPRRRKSVRVSLQPTYSVTPPAIEYDENEIGFGEEERNKDWRSHGSDTDESSGMNGENGRSVKGENLRDGGTAQDTWVDSSDEDIEYQKARRLLTLSSISKKSDRKKSKSKTHR